MEEQGAARSKSNKQIAGEASTMTAAKIAEQPNTERHQSAPVICQNGIPIKVNKHIKQVVSEGSKINHSYQIK